MDGYAGFAEYVAGHRAGLSRAAHLLTGDVHAAEDIVQDALVTAASRWWRIREGGDPDPYVRRILYTRHIDRWRRLRSRRSGSGCWPVVAEVTTTRSSACSRCGFRSQQLG